VEAFTPITQTPSSGNRRGPESGLTLALSVVATVMAKKIEVANPLQPHCRFISVDSARNYVKRGLAEWRGLRRIHFIRSQTDHREVSAHTTAARVSASGYDSASHSGFLRRTEAPNIPFVGNIDLLFSR
jgi:hypothetical protein